ncbi:hypothetical protein DICSQDRAFT_140324 [Dichomitus squalens LYAD-421 SS1]|uniref:Uncharacterized protein n=1 Tax=Dichomitus squalens (strain LYAD-421) TaxID=732165 RepID=R7SN57_DICSQ|nr:uncharacterized protein DICSQDRAFT_140324 [Dichomitus squalens LYAD-421 SS1]EJF57556.1 hypothetical protein DICSQDRAFT_140324 [Dichomitus squalens LYAD-421 SS1]
MDNFRSGNMSADSPYSGAKSIYADAASPYRLLRRHLPTLPPARGVLPHSALLLTDRGTHQTTARYGSPATSTWRMPR